MIARVKGRPYDNSARAQASRDRRTRVLATARALFLDRGYVRTTMSAIAGDAGVALDTVYALAGRKPDLFRLLIESAISGRDQAVPAEERAYVQRIHSAATAQGKLRVYAESLPEIMARLAPLVTLVHQASAAEPELADLWHEIAERRAANMRRFAAELEDTGQLAVPVDEAADIIWATNSTDLYSLLVWQRGWTDQRYGRWLGEAWERLLLSQGTVVTT